MAYLSLILIGSSLISGFGLRLIKDLKIKKIVTSILLVLLSTFGVVISSLLTDRFVILNHNIFNLSLIFDSLSKLYTGVISLVYLLVYFFMYRFIYQGEHVNSSITFLFVTLGLNYGIGYSGSLFTLFIFNALLSFLLYIYLYMRKIDKKVLNRQLIIFIVEVVLSLILLLMTSLTLGTSVYVEPTTRSAENISILEQIIYFFTIFIFNFKLIKVAPLFMKKYGVSDNHRYLIQYVMTMLISILVSMRLSYFNFNYLGLYNTVPQYLLIILSSLGMLYCAYQSFRNRNLIEIVKYIGLFQVAFIYSSIFIFNDESIIGTYYIALIHLIINLMLNLSVRYLKEEYHIETIEDLRKKKFSFVTLIFIITASLSFVGVPLLSGFISYYCFINTALDSISINYLSIISITISVMIISINLIKISVLPLIYKKDLISEEDSFKTKHLTQIPILILMVLTIILGISSSWLFEVIERLLGL